MDTQRMVEAVRLNMAVTVTYDPTADDCERWLACIGFDNYGAGHTPDEALDSAMNREALGPEPLPVPDNDSEPLPFTDEPNADDYDPGDYYDDPRSLGELPVLAGR